MALCCALELGVLACVNMRDFEKLPIWEHSVEWNMRIGVIISDEPRINDEIRVSQVRLIGPNGEQVGVIATSVALNLAKEANLDLVRWRPTRSLRLPSSSITASTSTTRRSRLVRLVVTRALRKSRKFASV